MIDEAVVIPVMIVHERRQRRCRWPVRWPRGGLTVLEITLRTEVALAAIAAIAEALPEVDRGLRHRA